MQPLRRAAWIVVNVRVFYFILLAIQLSKMNAVELLLLIFFFISKGLFIKKYQKLHYYHFAILLITLCFSQLY